MKGGEANEVSLPSPLRSGAEESYSSKLSGVSDG
jgi:hypothetical protein